MISKVDSNGSYLARNSKLSEIVAVSDDTTIKSLSNLEKDSEHEDDSPLPMPDMSPEAVTEFMSQVTNLVKLVDSKDVVELQLKQPGCELTIRKKEALPQPPAPAPVMMMPSHVPPSFGSFPPPPVHAPQAAPPPTSSPSADVPQEAPRSSHPPITCPMSGTFYRSPAPGQPPFVKVGDKVKKGQILCIIEAMKLMNEIEADHPGTVVDILAEDGKPIGLDQPMLVIEPF